MPDTAQVTPNSPSRDGEAPPGLEGQTADGTAADHQPGDPAGNSLRPVARWQQRVQPVGQ